MLNALRSRILSCPLCGFKVVNKKTWTPLYRLSSLNYPHLKLFSTSLVLQQKHEKRPDINLAEFPVERIRNFSIIAHVDHGKSTLADRLLEVTGVISDDIKNEQVLDKLQVERERGITVKAQTATLVHHYRGQDYLLNLIDTPGHVDFNYEVARSLSACQGVILLVDANQGVQAQTVANFYLAFEAELEVLPIINKIDLKVARPEEVAQQMVTMFDVTHNDIIKVSAKTGLGISDVLDAVVERIPHPPYNKEAPLQALLFDSWYDHFRGVVANVAMKSGSMKKGDRILSMHGKKSYEVQELGILSPGEMSMPALYAGQVGYVYANMKDVKEALIGDTFCHAENPSEALPGFKPAVPMVFAGVFAMEQSEFPTLKTAIAKLLLNDSSIQVNTDSSAILGQGYRLGFLGLLHMEVFSQRLEQEYDANVLITTPNVPYKVKIHGAKNIKAYKSDEITVLNPNMLPDPKIIVEYQEPYVLATIISPDTYLGSIMNMLIDRRGEDIDQSYIDDKRLMFKAVLPLNEVVVDFFDTLKSLTSGYASFDYEDHGYRPSYLVKIEIYLNGQPVDELTQIAHTTKAREVAKRVAARLQETLPQQLFEIAIQAKVGAKVLARQNIRALRKDVLAKCYGGDISRKMKLLKRQAEGKRKMKRIGNIDVPKDTFIKILQR